MQTNKVCIKTVICKDLVVKVSKGKYIKAMGHKNCNRRSRPSLITKRDLSRRANKTRNKSIKTSKFSTTKIDSLSQSA